jgi:Rad3-related DNA helicase
MKWSLYDKSDNYLEPFVFSNGKTQLDVVKEVVEAIEEGYKIIFIHGFCGTGKSCIALNIAKEVGKTSIVVPVKSLQNQYFEDYTNKFYIKKSDGNKLKINVMFGRQNFKCEFLNTTADNLFLPCNIDVNYEKNKDKLFEYIEKNPFVESSSIKNLKDIRRMSVAPACPYWSPVLPKDFDLKTLSDAEPKEYTAIEGRKYIFYDRGGKCSYYNQFLSYIDSDVLIFNSMKYELENLIGRKPETEVEIIDECDEFLDNLSNEKSININLLMNRLSFFMSKYPENKDILSKAYQIASDLNYSPDVENYIHDETIFELKQTKLITLMTYLFNHEISNLILGDDEDYLFSVYSALESFKGYTDETYVIFFRNKRNEINAKLVMVNLERRLKEFLDKNKVFVMMSGTIHSKNVLETVFGIRNFKIIEAEVNKIGTVTNIKTGLEREFNYSYLKNSREEYLRALNDSIEKAEKPVLIQVNSFRDLPNDYECRKYNLNLIKREDLISKQIDDKTGNVINDFKEGKIDVLYSTKCNRGVDFPGDTCNSIVFTKFPYPDRSSLFWKIISKDDKRKADLFYFDKSRREIIQRLYRGIRSKDDHVNVLSPDLRVLQFVNGFFG